MLHDVLKPLAVISIILIVTLFASQIIMGQISTTRLIGNKGRIEVEGVGVYSDLNCNTPIDHIDWGSLEPASTKNQTIFVRNEGNSPTSFFLATTDWNPANLSQYMHLTWNYEFQTVYPYETIQVTLTLTASSSPEFHNYVISNSISHFDFSIIIGIN